MPIFKCQSCAYRCAVPLLLALILANVVPATPRSPPTKGFFVTWDESPSLATKSNSANRWRDGAPAHTAGTIDFQSGKWENTLKGSYFYSYGATTSSPRKNGDVYTYSLLPYDDLGHVTNFQLAEDTKSNISGRMFWNTTQVNDVDHAPGAVQCDSDASFCYAFTFGKKQRDNALVKFSMEKDSASVIANLGQYDGYSIDASALNKKENLYYGIMVCISSESVVEPHAPRAVENIQRRKHKQVLSDKTVEGLPNISDQCLVTIDLNKKKILHSTPVSKDMMGPLAYDDVVGLLTFSPTIGDCACSRIDVKTGDETCVQSGTFGGFPYFHMLTVNDDGYFFGQFIRPNTRSKLAIVVGDLRAKPMQLLVNTSWDFDIHAPGLLD